jgi:Rab-GTPase-TBC domain
MFCKHSRLRGHGKLRRVLLAYGRYDREVQYCQVYNYTYLLLIDQSHVNAWWLSTC